MMLRAKFVIRSTAPPESMLNVPRMPEDCALKLSAKATGLMPGIGM
jgi:hypothetical protein